MNEVLVICDNRTLLGRIKKLLEDYEFNNVSHSKFQLSCSWNNSELTEEYKGIQRLIPVNLKNDFDRLASKYDLIVSLHCKQIFPDELLKKIRCINVHPGYNPYNRGWYPHIFSIINKKPCGVTIHEIYSKIDHGPVIIQKKIEVQPFDTSLSIYSRIIDTEIEILAQNLRNLIDGNYQTFNTKGGNINNRKDFEELCEINLENRDTFQNHINHLRALSHKGYLNAYFMSDNGEKIWLELSLKR